MARIARNPRVGNNNASVNAVGERGVHSLPLATPPVGGHIKYIYTYTYTYIHTYTMLHMKGLLFLLLGLAVTGQAQVTTGGRRLHTDDGDDGSAAEATLSDFLDTAEGLISHRRLHDHDDDLYVEAVYGV